jgi:hypothetical protein
MLRTDCLLKKTNPTPIKQITYDNDRKRWTFAECQLKLWDNSLVEERNWVTKKWFFI